MNVLFIILGILVAFAAGFGVRLLLSRRQLAGAEQKSKLVLEEAAREAEQTRKQAQLETKDLQHAVRQEFEEKTR